MQRVNSETLNQTFTFYFKYSFVVLLFFPFKQKQIVLTICRRFESLLCFPSAGLLFSFTGTESENLLVCLQFFMSATRGRCGTGQLQMLHPEVSTAHTHVINNHHLQNNLSFNFLWIFCVTHHHHPIKTNFTREQNFDSNELQNDLLAQNNKLKLNHQMFVKLNKMHKTYKMKRFG